MPSPTIEAQIDQYLSSAAIQSAYTQTQIAQLRTALLELADAAERGDAQARAQLQEIGISFAGRPLIPGYSAYGTGLWEVLQPSLVPAQLMEQQAQLGSPFTGQTEGAQAGYHYLGLGQVKYIDPDTGRAYFYQMTDVFGYPTDDLTEAVGLKPLSSAELQGETTAGWATASLRDLQYALDQGMITEEQYANELASRLLTPTGGGGMGEYQAGQLDISRQRLGLDIQEAERNWLQTQIEAARTAQPLTYLGLLRGQVPGAGGTELYQGVKPVVPNILSQTQPTGERRWQAPLLPPAMQTVQAGGVLKPTALPTGTPKLPGVQAQAAMTPYERAAYGEAAEYAGIPRMDWDAYLKRTRTAIGQGLSPYTYGGINVRR